MGGSTRDSTFIYLTNLDEDLFAQKWREANVSSLSDEYFPVEEALLVEWELEESGKRSR